ncbi:MAG: AAA family ATPase, partial [Caldilineaceae bacterium]|nr:AAA family ATPase [Caldilineaceae bacterium]
MAQLALYLLGSPRIEVDGKVVKVQRRKAVALLAYLAATGESHSREKLATLLWPESNESSIRNNLRVALAEIRRKLGGEQWLTIDGERVGLKHSPSLWVDTVQFQHLEAQCAEHDHVPEVICDDCLRLLDEATMLYRDDLLAGFSLSDSPGFDEWQFFQAEGLRQTLTHILDRLVQGYKGNETYELAIPYARRRLAIDPLHEPAHRQLMELYAYSNQFALAERQYQECQRILTAELDVELEAETSALYEQIKRRMLPDPKSAAAVSLPPSTQPSLFQKNAMAIETEQSIFVARGYELAQLDSSLAAALSGQGRVVFVTGETGTGKTALIQEFARRVRNTETNNLSIPPQGQPPIVLQGNCSAYTGIGDPYLPFRAILSQLTGDVHAQRTIGAIRQLQSHHLWQAMPRVIQALLTHGPDLISTFISGPQLVKRVSSVAAPGTDWLIQLEEHVARQVDVSEHQHIQQNRYQRDLFAQYTQVLQTLAQQQPLLVLIEDLQWADMGSISLLFHLGLRLQGSRILVVGTYRPSDIALGRNEERHPLASVVNEFRRHYGQIEIDLSQAEGRQFVDGLIDAEPNQLSRAFREALYHHTQGHALFTAEILRSMQARGDLVQDEVGRWIVGPMVDWQQLPARVEGVIAERIERLLPAQQELLTVASVEGELFTAEIVAQVQSTDVQKIVQALSRGLDKQHHLIRSEGNRRLETQRLSMYRFQHILYQAYLYDRLDEAERIYLHEAVAYALEQLYWGQMSEIAVQLAYHWQEAGVTEKAIDALYQAGHRAFERSGHEEAITHLTRGLMLLETLPDTESRHAQALKFQIALWACYLLPAALSRARNLGEQWLDHAEKHQNETSALLGHGALGVTLTKTGELAAAYEHLAQFMARFDPKRHRSLTTFIDLDPMI